MLDQDYFRPDGSKVGPVKDGPCKGLFLISDVSIITGVSYVALMVCAMHDQVENRKLVLNPPTKSVAKYVMDFDTYFPESAIEEIKRLKNSGKIR